MKFISADQTPRWMGNTPCLELSRRNLEVLLAKLDDPASAATIGDPYDNVWVRAVEGEEDDIQILVRPVENAEHYSDRPAGAMYMPSSGVVL